METYRPNEGVRPEIPKEGIGGSCYINDWNKRHGLYPRTEKPVRYCCEAAKEIFAEMKPSVTREEAHQLLGLGKSQKMSYSEVLEAIADLRKEQDALQEEISKLYELKWQHEKLDELCEVDLS